MPVTATTKGINKFIQDTRSLLARRERFFFTTGIGTVICSVLGTTAAVFSLLSFGSVGPHLAAPTAAIAALAMAYGSAWKLLAMARDCRFDLQRIDLLNGSLKALESKVPENPSAIDLDHFANNVILLLGGHARDVLSEPRSRQLQPPHTLGESLEQKEENAEK